MRAPFPWFGGKSGVTELVWERFGNTPNYVEPFFGRGAVLLARPHQAKIETINDRDCFVANFWRALQADPDAVARHAADEAERTDGLYAADDGTVSHAVREWAIEWGNDPRMRIALCGYEGEHALPDSWECIPWKARGGYGSQGDQDGVGRNNSGRERIWFSPHCLRTSLFSQLVGTEDARSS
jgi:DNA adenine methylase